MRKIVSFFIIPALVIGLALTLLPGSADAKTLKFAFQGDIQSMDPYNLNETFHLGFHGNVYEGLTRRGSLACSEEP